MADITRKCSNINEYSDVLIGKGTLGEVHKGTLNGKDVAVKVIKSKSRDLSVLDKVMTNTNIIAIMVYEYRDKESALYISMELLDQNLDQYIAGKQLSDLQIEDILRQCAAGICFLHDNNEVHRRMKPSNFLIQLKGPDNIIVKASDWFLKKTQEDSDVYSHWFAPEESITNPVMSNEIGYKMNVFSFAILVMHVGGKEDVREHIRSNTRIGEDVYNEKNVFEDFSISWQSMSFRDFIVPLLIKTLSLDPEVRPTMKTVCHFLERKLTYPQLRLNKIENNIISSEGSFGVIYKGEYNGQEVAIKTINKHRIDISRRQQILTSATIILMKRLRHPNVIQLLVFEDKTPNNLAEFWIGMELCDWSLDKYLVEYLPDEKETRSILRQCARGLLYLHDNKLSHRDFKPNNILIKKDGDNKIVKITDFSLTKDIEGHESSAMTSVHGNRYWLTPEQMTDTFDKLQEFQYKGSEIFPVDVFQYALVIIYVCINKEERDKMFKTIYIGRDVKMGKNVLDYFANYWNHENLRCHLEPLLTKILISDPQQRPTMHEVIEFFQPPKISTTLSVLTHILGEVHKGSLNGKDVAVKVINTRNRDLSVLDKVLTDTNIIPIMAYEYREQESVIYISMALLDQNLDQYIAGKQLSDVQIEDILRQCAAGICFLHNNNEVHRRMKPSNFLIQIKDCDYIIVKASDWFLEKTEEDSDVYSHWFAPEESTTNPVMSNKIGYKMNVFSFAILVMHVGAKEDGRERIKNNTTIGEDVYNEKNVLEDFSISWQSMSFRDFIVPLLIKTLDLNPDVRPTMKTVCQFLEKKLTYPQLQLNRIEKNIISSEGSFGMIYRGEYDGQVVAIKTINMHKFDERRRKKILASETVIWMKKLRHTNVIHFLVCQDKTPNNIPEIWIGMELCDWSLDKYLVEYLPDEKETRSISRQCARGLSYLHDNKLSHRDFKPNNILIKKDGDNKTVKITDFSLTKDIEGHESTAMTSVHGNPHWLTPEQMTDTFEKLQEFEYKGSEIFPVDVFQYALVIIYVCINKEERDKMFKTIYIGRDVKMGKNVLDYFANHWNHENLRCHLEPLLTKILISDPQQRPTMHEVIEFFQPPKISTTLPVLTHILGEVHKGSLNGKDVAVKVINTRNRDLSVLDKVLTDTNIIPIMAYEYREQESAIYISMEFLDQNLDQYIAGKQLSDVQIEDILRQCAAGICFLHDNNEVHRRMKPSNFLIQLKGPDNIIVKASDWFLEKTEEDSDVNSHWFAPEESTTNPVMSNEIGYKMNVFSFAILVMHVGGKEDGREHIQNNTIIGEDVNNEKNVLEDFSIFWQSMSFRDFVVPLLIKTLSLDPEVRPTMKTVCHFLERKLTYPQLRLNRIENNIISSKGSFGVIYKGEYNGQEVAIKTINKHRIDISRRQQILTSETIILMKHLRHPNVIQLLMFEDKTPNNLAEIWIGMELCDWSLDKYLSGYLPDEKETRSISWQCARGLLYLHDNHLSHRDFKPNNILIKKDGDNKIVKITDFSLTKDIEGHESTTMTSVHGNPHWLTPEQMTDTFDKLQEFEYKGSEIFPVDVFQYALVMIYVCINKEERDKMFKTIYIGRDVKMGKNVLDYFINHWNHENLRCHLEPLLTKILISDPQQRPTMHEVIEFFQPPKISTTLPVLTHITSHNLGLKADWYVGINSNDGCVLLGRKGFLFKKRGKLLLYQLQDNEMKQLWGKQCPDGVTWKGRKYISGHIEELLFTTRDYSDSILCHDGNLRRQHEHRVGEGMRLIGVLPGAGHRMVYVDGTTDGYKIHIYPGDSRLLSLQPPPGIQWDSDLSLCHEERSGWFAVTDTDNRSLCIYDAAGMLQHHVSLTYKPHPWNAVTCTRHHILVGEWDGTTVHIHSWDGQHLRSVYLRDKVKLGKGENQIHALGVSDGGCSLIVATGLDYVTSLHALKIH